MMEKLNNEGKERKEKVKNKVEWVVDKKGIREMSQNRKKTTRKEKITKEQESMENIRKKKEEL